MKHSMIVHPDEVSKDRIDKLVQAGITTLGIHPIGGADATDALDALLQKMKTAEFRRLIDYAEERGVSVEYELHAAGYLLPRNYFETHPQYFRMNENGQRTPDWNFCVSDQEALTLFSERAARLALSLYKSTHDYYFWMDDGHKIYCHCPKCRKYSASDQQLIAVNAMMRQIKKHIPDARMAYLAYCDSVVPPAAVQPEDGVFLEYAPFEKYTAKGEDAPQLIEREKEMIAPLMNFFAKQPKKVLEYWYDNSVCSKWRKPPVKFVLNQERMQADIAEYRHIGFDVISTFACYLGEDYKALYGDVDITPFSKCLAENPISK